jgi:hypothetical protein
MPWVADIATQEGHSWHWICCSNDPLAKERGVFTETNMEANSYSVPFCDRLFTSAVEGDL